MWFYSQAFGAHSSICAVCLSCEVAAMEVHALWRTRLCRHGPNCEHVGCVFAHRLCDLSPPYEVDKHYDHAWAQGVDRWYGQPMSPEQLSMIKRYYSVTPAADVPIWAEGLRYFQSKISIARDAHLPWDYGLEKDLELLCVYRNGKLPFQFMEGLWPCLDERWKCRRAKLEAASPIMTNTYTQTSNMHVHTIAVQTEHVIDAITSDAEQFIELDSPSYAELVADGEFPIFLGLD